MDVKAIVQNPQSAIAATWGSCHACPNATEVHDITKRIAELKSVIKETKAEKGRIAGQFKDAKGNPDKTAQLKQQMASVSARLSEQEKQRKALEKDLLSRFKAEKPDKRPAVPSRFTAGYAPAKLGERLRVVLISDDESSAWDAYVDSSPRASLYHRYAWRKVIETAFGHPCHYYVARNEKGNIRGVLPLTSMKSRLFGNFAVSLPFFNYGGAVADSREAADLLYSHANAEARAQAWDHIEYRTCEGGLAMPSTQRKVSMVLRLPESTETLDSDLGAKVRAQCKQTRRHRPFIHFGSSELLDDFYQVFSRNMRDLGTPVYSRTFFATILQALPSYCTLVSVRIGDKPVGAAFLAGYKDMLEIPWASTLREYNDCNVNMWMYREILAHAIAQGYHYFDFGRSTQDAGTYQFKKQWGAKPVQHHWYYHLPNGTGGDGENSIPKLNPDNPKYRLAIAAWKRLPLPVANAVGPYIVRNLP